MYYLLWLLSYINYIRFAYIPLLIQAELHYSVQYVNITYSMALLACHNIHESWFKIVIFWWNIVDYGGLIIIIGIGFRLIDPEQRKTYNISLIIFIAFLYDIVYTADDVFLTCTVARLTMEDIQSFANVMPGMVRIVGATLHCLSVPLFIQHKNVFYITSSLAVIICDDYQIHALR